MLEPARFHLFGTDHLAVLGLLAVLGVLVSRAGRSGRPVLRDRLGLLLGLILLAYGVTMYAQLAYRGLLSWAYSLPLELCHWVLIACLAALFTGNRLAAEISYFWGLGGTLQAVLTPDLQEGFPSWDFIQFFWAHGCILLAIVYLIVARGFRPGQRSVARMMLAVNIYLLVAGCLDRIFGWNYGYLCRPPGQPSLLDYLGPWPWYILSMEAVALGLFWLLALPWRFTRRSRE